jgi:hypothetical protein
LPSLPASTRTRRSSPTERSASLAAASSRRRAPRGHTRHRHVCTRPPRAGKRFVSGGGGRPSPSGLAAGCMHTRVWQPAAASSSPSDRRRRRGIRTRREAYPTTPHHQFTTDKTPAGRGVIVPGRTSKLDDREFEMLPAIPCLRVRLRSRRHMPTDRINQFV